MKPAAAARRPSRKAAPTDEVINEGDKICGQCGAGNDPKRNFCRRCGASLVEAQLFKLGFFARLRRSLFHRRQHQAGARPKVRRRALGGAAPGWLTSWVTRIIVLAIAVFVVLSFVGPWHKKLHPREVRYYNDVAGLVHPVYNPLYAVCPVESPTGCPATPALASSSTSGHPAGLAVDGALNTSWQSAAPSNQWLNIWFATPATVAKIGFDSGDQDGTNLFSTMSRPEEVKLVFFRGDPRVPPNSPQANNVVAVKTVLLQDVASFQTFTVSAKSATGVSIYIERTYPAANPNVAIAQVEFFTKN